MIIGQMTGRDFKFCHSSDETLEHIQNWLAEKGLMSSINIGKRTIEIFGYVNGRWKEDVNGNLFRIE